LLDRGEVGDSLLAGNVLLTHPPFPFAKKKVMKTVPQKEILDRQEVVYESLALGGRTRINAALYLQGCPEEYASWGKGWQWDDVAPYFARSEGRLEVEKGVTPEERTREGGEWKTRIIKAHYESSRRYFGLRSCSWKI